MPVNPTDPLDAFKAAMGEGESACGPKPVGFVAVPPGHPIAQAVAAAKAKAAAATGHKITSIEMDFRDGAEVFARALRELAETTPGSNETRLRLLSIAVMLECQRPTGWVPLTVAQVLTVFFMGPEEHACLNRLLAAWFAGHAEQTAKILADMRGLAADWDRRLAAREERRRRVGRWAWGVAAYAAGLGVGWALLRLAANGGWL